MKKQIFIAVFAMTALFISCKKEDFNTQSFQADFNKSSDLDDWNVFGDCQAEIVDGAIYISNVNDCVHLEPKELLDVDKNSTYKITVSSKHNPTQVGDPAYCVGNLMLRIMQDGETLMIDGLNASNDFAEQQFSFTTQSGSSVQLEFLVGTIHGAWIDNIRLEKI